MVLIMAWGGVDVLVLVLVLERTDEEADDERVLGLIRLLGEKRVRIVWKREVCIFGVGG